MLDSILTATADTAGTISITGFLICVFSALALGLILTLVYQSYARTTKSFAVTLATLPAIVAVIIMMVNGNIGAGVATAGAFSLVRFRSIPGSAKDICAVFLAMAVGLACGMGYPVFALCFTVILCLVYLLYAKTGFGERNIDDLHKTLRVTVPEDLEYGTMFDDLMEQYTTRSALTQVKTTNLGSLNRLTYDVTLRQPGTEKAFIDALRCRNGNLEIGISAYQMEESEL